MKRPRLIALALLWVAFRASAQPVEEVPFVTTPDNVTLAMLQLAGVGPKDHVLDLGSGDGRIVITAARRFGARGVGVEIVPDLVQRSLDNAKRLGVSGRTEFVVQDLFQTDLSQASVITMYLLPDVNLALRPKLLQLAPGTRIVSHDWDMGDWKPDQTVTVDAPDKPIGREKLSRLHRWVVPARVQGLWCAADGSSWRFEQRHQFVEATLQTGVTASSWSGRLDGAALRLQGAGALQARAQVQGDSLRLHGPRLATEWRRESTAQCPVATKGPLRDPRG